MRACQAASTSTARFGAQNGIDSFGNQTFTHADLPVAIGDSGAIVFGAAVRDTGYQRRPSVWTNRSGQLELLMLGSTNQGGNPQDGSPAPGYPAGAGCFDFGSCFALLNSADEIALTANVVTASPVTITRAIYWDRPGTLTLVARVLGPVPGVPGAVFNSVQLSTFSDGGVLWYSGVLGGPGVYSSNDFAAFLVQPDGSQELVLREGGACDLFGDGSDVRTVATFGLGAGATDAGERVFEVIFTDGTHGAFTCRRPLALAPLFADELAIDVAEGAFVDFALDAGPALAGRSYRLFAGATGTSPGFTLPGGLVLPLNVDALTRRFALHANTPFFERCRGRARPDGCRRRAARPPGLDRCDLRRADLEFCLVHDRAVGLRVEPGVDRRRELSANQPGAQRAAAGRGPGWTRRQRSDDARRRIETARTRDVLRRAALLPEQGQTCAEDDSEELRTTADDGRGRARAAARARLRARLRRAAPPRRAPPTAPRRGGAPYDLARARDLAQACAAGRAGLPRPRAPARRRRARDALRPRRPRASSRGAQARARAGEPVEDLVSLDPLPGIDCLALHEALERLAAIDERKARVVELRFFGGLEIEEIAAVLTISPATVKRDWPLAKAWLYRELGGGRETRTDGLP